MLWLKQALRSPILLHLIHSIGYSEGPQALLQIGQGVAGLSVCLVVLLPLYLLGSSPSTLLCRFVLVHVLRGMSMSQVILLR